MIGAIAGDIIGSIYEAHNIKSEDFPLFSRGCTFTDDTVLTVAVADCILHDGDYAEKLKEYYFMYPYAGYGGAFHAWTRSDSNEPYKSWGNGSAMRVSPVGFAYNDLEEVLEQAKRSAEVTHNHPEGIKGAQATASAIFLARQGKTKGEIKSYIEGTFLYSLQEKIDEIRQYYTFDISCQGSVPQAITAFLESESYEDAVRKAVSIGGDSDTIACIAGGIAEAYYKGIPEFIFDQAYSILDNRLKSITEEFRSRYVTRTDTDQDQR
ncbi:MAG: ADP-ribosylglycohydrolase family protein [Thermodesulfobacteriota bacterium]|nr:ADP-ribosylglycohydrolase family protein [Thermodesulfobacteriota bacterium]